ncbi:MAG: GAF domain-containing protein [Planctomycetes bacterium]|nr:GAF domain-containing protein [Planctomycetota bacterium]
MIERFGPIGGRYQPLELLGRGASGEVLRVVDRVRGGPPLALKRVPAARAAAVQGEFRRLHALRSPGIPQVDELGLDPQSGEWLFTAEPGRGVPFLTALRTAPLTRQQKAVADLLRTLALLSERSIVHRDLKPEHLLVEGGDEPRVLVVDFGLAIEGTGAAAPAGSLPYLAPELFHGVPASHSSDLYALGVILFELWSGRHPFRATTPTEWARAHLDAPVRFDDSFAAPAAMREWVARLLAKAPGERATSAVELLFDLSRVAAVPLPRTTLATLLGRIRSVPPLDPTWRESVMAGESRAGGPATWITAPTRAGRDQLMRELRMTALQGEAWPVIACFAPGPDAGSVRGTVRDQLRALLGAEPAVGDDELFLRLQRGDLPRRLVLFLEEVPECAAEDDALLRFLLRASVEIVASGAGGSVRDERVTAAWPAALERRTIEPRAITSAELLRLFPGWMGGPLSEPLARFLGAGANAEHDVSRLVELLCYAVDAGALVADFGGLHFDPARIDLAILGGDVLEVTRQRLGRVGGTRRDVLAALCVLEHDAEVDLIAALVPTLAEADLAELAATGLVQRLGTRWRCSETSVAALVRDRLTPAAARPLEVAASRFLTAHPERTDARLRQTRHAFRADVTASDAARDFGQQALALVDFQRLQEAEAAAQEVLAHSLDATARRRATLARGIVELRMNSHLQAEQILAPLADQFGADEPERGRALVEHARALSRCGRTQEALARLDLAPDDLGSRPAGAAALRAYLLHQLLRDDEAEIVCRAALAEPRAAGDSGELRLRSIHAVTLWRLGRIGEARVAFGIALHAARMGALPLQVAVVESNLARFEGDCGNLELAASIARRAIATTVAFGDRQQEAVQVTTLANILFDIGRFAECKEALQRSREIAHAMNQPHVLRHVDIIQAHVAMNEADFAAAHAALDRAKEVARSMNDEAGAWRAELVRTELLMREGKGRAARRLIDEVAKYLVATGRADEVAIAAEYRLQWATFAAGRGVVARLLESELPLPPSRRRRAFLRDARLSALHRLGRHEALAKAAAEQLDDLASSDLVALRARAAAALALAVRGDPARAPACIEQAREAYGATRAPGHMALKAEAALMLGRAARDRRLLEEAEEFARRAGHRPLEKRARALRRRLLPPDGADVDAVARLQSLERLMQVAKRITATLDGELLLKMVLDDAVDATRAARGFLILSRDGELGVRCARNLDAADIERPELSFSSSVARSVYRTGTPILLADVSTDELWCDAASISQLKLLSVLCVPIARHDHVIGAVYLDEPTRIDAFRPGDLRYVENLADFAAIALEKADLLADARTRRVELESSQAEIASLNQKLQATMFKQQDELKVAKASLELAHRMSGRVPQFEGIVAQSRAMEEVKQRIERLASSPLPVLVSGESGTGKELVARAIHARSGRLAQPFQAFNCATTQPGLIENELFGHQKGAFTGATENQPGLFERCDGGTLFLDEIAEASKELQAKLLRAVQNGEVQRLGGGETRHVDVRIVAASNRDIRSEVAAGRFREDLMYRLMVLQVHLPPLRDRREDVALLLDHFVTREAAKLRVSAPVFTPAAWRCLVGYDWPGNVREVENVVQRLLVLHRDAPEIGIDALRAELPSAVSDVPVTHFELREFLDSQERTCIEEALARCGGNRQRAAKELGISERNLYQRLQRWRTAATDR